MQPRSGRGSLLHRSNLPEDSERLDVLLEMVPDEAEEQGAALGTHLGVEPEAQNFFLEARERGKKLVISAEVLQELLHAYLPMGRLATLDAALGLAARGVDEVLPVKSEAVIHARRLADQYAALTARDLLHLSRCQLRRIGEVKTFDRSLAAAFRNRSRKT